nr:hypothetical protein Iba_scaffold6333CG0110 [Ipomoea batatas]
MRHRHRRRSLLFFGHISLLRSPIKTPMHPLVSSQRDVSDYVLSFFISTDHLGWILAAATDQSMNLLLLLIVMASSSQTFTSFLTIIADHMTAGAIGGDGDGAMDATASDGVPDRV